MEIKHDLTGSRFVMLSGGSETGQIVYDVEEDGNLTALSVHVTPEMQGQGAAGNLLGALVDHAKKHSLKIYPACPYVLKQFERNPEKYSDVAGGPPPKR